MLVNAAAQADLSGLLKSIIKYPETGDHQRCVAAKPNIKYVTLRNVTIKWPSPVAGPQFVMDS
jgi:hypothetical protein